MKFRPRFRLRTLLIAIALLSIPMGWVAYQLNWIRERHEFLKKYGPYFYYPGYFVEPTGPPWPLGLFGEEQVWAVGNFPKSEHARAIELFPEAWLFPIKDNSQSE